MKKTHLLMIDPQNDFCIKDEFGIDWNKLPWNTMSPDVAGHFKNLQKTEKHGALVVPGADKDMERLAAFIKGNEKRISEIHCTVDSHQIFHIAHPIFWVDSYGNHPAPFTRIPADEVKTRKWRTTHQGLEDYGIKYVTALENAKRNVLVIWPPHCLIQSWGHGIVRGVSDALNQWEQNGVNRVNYVTKGSNFLTEHYSGVMADVPDDGDPTTKLNVELIDALKEADEIVIMGEALSHCVKWTVKDIADNFGDEHIKKFNLLTDCSSSVTGFEKDGQDFITEMLARGMRITTTTAW